MIDFVPPFFIAIGMTASSAGALTSERNHRGAADSWLSWLRIETASDGSPMPARTWRRCWRLADQRIDRGRFRGLGRAGERSRDEILGQAHRALRFGAGPTARLEDVMDGVDRDPEDEQRREDEINSICQGN